MNAKLHKWGLRGVFNEEKSNSVGYCPICKKVVKMRKNNNIQSIHDQRYYCIKCERKQNEN